MLFFRALFILPFLAFTTAAPVENTAIVERGVITTDLTNLFASVQPNLDNLSSLIKGGNKNATYVGGLLAQVETILTTVLQNLTLSDGLVNANVGAGLGASLPIGTSTKGTTVTQVSSALQNFVNNVNGVIAGLPSDTKKVPVVNNLIAKITPLLTQIVAKTNSLLPGVTNVLNNLTGSLSKLIGSI